MAIDYSGSAFPKGRASALVKGDAKRAQDTTDKKENAKAKKRANGQCEVVFRSLRDSGNPWGLLRCPHVDQETHHLIGGIGRRNKGKSILAAYKLRVCSRCHSDITKNTLRPTTAEHDASTVRYWRAR